MPDCELCQIVVSGDPVIWRGKHWLVRLANDQGYLGRCMVIALRHTENLSDLSTEEWTELHSVIQKLEDIIKADFGAKMFNWTSLMNDAFKSDDPHPHVHFHVWPRYDKDVDVAGEKFIDPNFGHHYDKKHQYKVSAEVRQAIMDRLKEQIDAN